MAFSKQEYWRGLPFFSPGDLPDPRIRFVSLMSSTLAVGFSIIWVIRESPLKVGRNGLGFSIWILLLLFSHVRLFATSWTAACQASLSITNSGSLLKLLAIELVVPSNHLNLYHPILLLLSMFPNNRVFSEEPSLCTRWPRDWCWSHQSFQWIFRVYFF